MPKASAKNVALLVALFAAAAVFALICVLGGPGGSHRTLFELAGERVVLVAAAFALLAAAVGFGLACLVIFDFTPRNAAERLVSAGGLGLGVFALATLALGSLGALSQTAVLVLIAVGVAVGCWSLKVRKTEWKPQTRVTGAWWVLIFLVACSALVIVLAAATDAILPPVEYDDLEYHLGAPAHYFKCGKIARVEGNVYANFPQNGEMLHLAAFYLAGDVQWGAVIARMMNLAVALLLGGAVYAAGRSLFGVKAGVVAAGIFLTTPWVYRISIKAYVENLLALYALLAVWFALKTLWREDGRGRIAAASGVFAGLALGTKYTAAVFVVAPLALFFLVLIAATGRKSIKPAALFAAGCFAAFLPWAVKNVVLTGNPVFPLLYGSLGGSGWSAKLAAGWAAAHAPGEISLKRVSALLKAIPRADAFLNPSMFVLLPFAFLGSRRRLFRLLLAAFALFYLCAWLLCTHQVDRFYYALIPVVCLLAGYGFSAVKGRGIQSAAGLLLAACAVASAVFVDVQSKSCWAYFPVSAPDYNFGVSDWPALFARMEPGRLNVVPAWHAGRFARRNTTSRSKMLSVCDAQNFYFPENVIYGTPHDRNLLGELLESGKTGAEICRELLGRHRVRFIYVNWLEYRRIAEKGLRGGVPYFMWRGRKEPWISPKISPELFDIWTKERLIEKRAGWKDAFVIYEITVGRD